MRILVAMSGGVDSSVVAGLLREQGHEVIGATLLLYDHAEATRRRGACCAGEDIHDARRVADTLGIAHYVLDRIDRFRAAVIDDFADRYAAGETPIPCIRCNQTVKFHDLVALARELGCASLATGHYARRTEGPELHQAADPLRDQSYFLAMTTPEQLAFARFPLGDQPDKAAVRAVAARLGLDVADKPDSQDICFVPAGAYHALVGRLRPDAAEPGEIVDAAGQVLGRHAGIARYTVGQGRGLGLARREDAEPLYVAEIDAPRRRVVVAPRAALCAAEIAVGGVNWLIDPADAPAACTVKLRAREAPHPAAIAWDAAAQMLHIRPEVRAIAAPGQACVLYAGTRVLAGGTIRGAPALTVAAAAT